MNLTEVISVFLLSSVKFFFAPAAAAASGFSYWETVVVTTAGGVSGVTFFYYFGHWIFKQIDDVRARRRKYKPRKMFSKKNRTIIHIKRKFGLIGLIIVTPAILSIPIGCVVAAKFYFRNRLTYPLLVFSTFCWSAGLSYFAHSVKDAIIY